MPFLLFKRLTRYPSVLLQALDSLKGDLKYKYLLLLRFMEQIAQRIISHNTKGPVQGAARDVDIVSWRFYLTSDYNTGPVRLRTRLITWVTPVGFKFPVSGLLLASKPKTSTLSGILFFSFVCLTRYPMLSMKWFSLWLHLTEAMGLQRCSVELGRLFLESSEHVSAAPCVRRNYCDTITS